MVALLASNLGRFSLVHQCFQSLEVPEGTHREWYTGRVQVDASRNRIVELFLKRGGAWLAMIDDDQVFLPDTLTRLLKRLDDNPHVDILAPLIYSKHPPYGPVCYDMSGANGSVELSEITLTNQRGLLPVAAVGAGVILIRRRVFSEWPAPWFGRHPDISEDMYFCLQAKHNGFEIAVDLDVTVGHAVMMSVWPTFAGGRWQAAKQPLPDGDQQTAVANLVLARQASEKGGGL